MSFFNYLVNLSVYIWVIFIVFNVGGFILFKKILYKRLSYRKIVPLESTHAQHFFELQNAIIANMIFILTGSVLYFLYQKGLTQIYTDISKYHWVYLVVSFFIIHTFHDTYFYWTHRAMHEVKFLRPFHVAHHKSKVPSPFAALSFSYDEAIIQALFYIFVAIMLPVHWGMIAFFYLFISWISMWGHTEFEFWPNNLFRFPYASTFNSLTHHNLHHYYGSGNYSLYYRFWDEVCGTGNKKTYDHFYQVRKNIEEHFGRSASVLRPKPYDQAGLYFEQLENFGEEIGVTLAKINKSDEVTELKKSELTSIPHSFADGISSLKYLHKINQKEISVYPAIRRHRDSRLTWNQISFSLGKMASIGSILPYRKFNINNEHRRNISDESMLYSINFTIEETAQILRNAKNKNVKVNSFVVHSISEIYSEYCKNILWLIPAWYPTKSVTMKSADIRNHTSFVEFKFSKNSDVMNVEEELKKLVNSQELWFWSKSFDFLNILLKYPFVLIVYFTKKCLKRTGTISNLGSFKGDMDAPIAFAPPALENSPISFGVLTYNDQMSISVAVHKEIGPKNEVVKSVLKKLRVNLLDLK